jgi:hypothetical protein
MAQLQQRAVVVSKAAPPGAEPRDDREPDGLRGGGVLEIADCFAFWTWLGQGRSPAIAALWTVSLAKPNFKSWARWVRVASVCGRPGRLCWRYAEREITLFLA